MIQPNQWETEGRCDWCRRKDYCTRKCKKRRTYEAEHRRAIDDVVFSAIAKRLAVPQKVNSEIYSALENLNPETTIDPGIYNALEKKVQFENEQ